MIKVGKQEIDRNDLFFLPLVKRVLGSLRYQGWLSPAERLTVTVPIVFPEKISGFIVCGIPFEVRLFHIIMPKRLMVVMYRQVLVKYLRNEPPIRLR